MKRGWKPKVRIQSENCRDRGENGQRKRGEKSKRKGGRKKELEIQEKGSGGNALLLSQTHTSYYYCSVWFPPCYTNGETETLRDLCKVSPTDIEWPSMGPQGSDSFHKTSDQK